MRGVSILFYFANYWITFIRGIVLFMFVELCSVNIVDPRFTNILQGLTKILDKYFVQSCFIFYTYLSYHSYLTLNVSEKLFCTIYYS